MNRLKWVASGLTLILAAALFASPTGGALAGQSFPSKVVATGAASISKSISLGLNKSVIIELPRAARDVLVSNPAIVDAVVRTKQRTFLIGKAVGETNVFFFGAEGRQILTLSVQVSRDVTDLSKLLRRLMPASRIKIESIGENIILSGRTPNAVQADRAAEIAGKFLDDPGRKKIINMIAAQGRQQVTLKVSIVEMQRTLLKQLGVDVAAVTSIASNVINLASVNPFSIAGQFLSATNASFGTAKVVSTGAAVPTGVNVGAAIGGGNGVSGVLRAMERNGLLRTLAEPNLTTISGETANFLAGGEFPVPVAQRGDRISIEFKPFGVSLAFTPVVLDEGRISIKVATEVSELTNDGAFTLTGSAGITIPGLKVRRANTTVEMPSGGSLVMAGLIQEESKHNLNGLPGLKSLPVLGALFRSRDFENSETELVVIVTPYIVKPVSRKRLARPDEGFAPPSDEEVTFLGRLNAVYGAQSGKRPSGNYIGDIGYIMK
ncbi:MAG: type II and III secretion system protein family protein [Alphaproteobacteria bacterium]